MINLWTGRRRAWTRLQNVVGVWCAYGAITAIAERSWWSAVFSVSSVLVTACWKLPAPDKARK